MLQFGLTPLWTIFLLYHLRDGFMWEAGIRTTIANVLARLGVTAQPYSVLCFNRLRIPKASDVQLEDSAQNYDG